MINIVSLCYIYFTKIGKHLYSGVIMNKTLFVVTNTLSLSSDTLVYLDII